jgi:hypothetical protein
LSSAFTRPLRHEAVIDPLLEGVTLEREAGLAEAAESGEEVPRTVGTR